jgi:hypothetical protein
VSKINLSFFFSFFSILFSSSVSSFFFFHSSSFFEREFLTNPLNPPSSRLSFLGAGITGMYNHAWKPLLQKLPVPAISLSKEQLTNTYTN